ncbi:MAG: 3-phosphoshikimate 1-carboxyvinyltransferase [Planctomycetes bacterium]|nr:3-phosphoshikimate 1-carboxyvinyltransferase [Planctomycetota bacterium]
MSDPLLIQPVSGPVRGSIRPPGSKSLTNRALIVAAMAEGPSRLRGLLDSTDTQVMLESLRRLGIAVRHDRAACVAEVKGCSGKPPATEATLWLENSGTSIRFLTALCTLGNGTFRLDGNERMRQRPIRDLVDALNALGADVTFELETDCPPVLVQANGLPGGKATVAGNISSQYLSALLMVAPGARSAVELDIEGELVSKPYVAMTLAVMSAFGCHVNADQPGIYRIEPQSYRAREYDIEPDASAASYFFAAAAITGGEVTIEGLSRDSLQGDIGFVDVLEQMGCRVDRQPDSITVHGSKLQGIDVDMNAVSDTAQTLAVVAVFAEGPTRIRNVAHIRHKETDRIAAVAAELRRLKVAVEEHPDGLTIHPGPIQPATIQTYDDHRMAMSFALIGLRSPGIRIADPGCTAKTYPHYFEDLQKLCDTAR